MDPIHAGIIGLVALLVVVGLGIHIGVALGLVGFLGLWLLTGSISPAYGLIATSSYENVTTYAFSALPLFILMGILALNSGISDSIYDTAYKWLGRLPGGLAMTTVVANAAFGAVTGSSAVSVTVFTKIALPPMLKRKYSKSLATGSILGSGLLGMLIPPSTLAVLYGIIAEISIGHLLMAGIGPALVLVCVYCIYIYLRVRLKPIEAPLGAEKFTLKEKVVSLKGMITTVIIGGAVIFGMYTGFFSPTEAGGFASALVLVLGIGLRKMKLSGFTSSILEATRVTAMLFLIYMTSIVFGRFLALSTIPVAFSNWVAESGLPTMGVVGMFMLMYLALGCVLDSSSMLFITLPIVHPVIMSLGLDPIWFATCVILTIEAGFLTPPVGLAIYNLKAVAGDMVDVVDLFRGATPFFLLSVLIVIVIVFVPQIVVFIPNSMFGG